MKKVIPVDVYDKDGNLSKIEFNEKDGTHVVDALWDPKDEQTSENRVLFRQWAYRMLEQQGYEIPR